MEIVGSVAPDEVPAHDPSRRRGIWSELADRAITDHESGRVTVVRLEGDKELLKLRNNLGQYVRKKGYRMHPVVIKQPDGMRVFLELRLPPETDGRVL